LCAKYIKSTQGLSHLRNTTMVKTFNAGELENIPRNSLSIGSGEFSGDLIKGGTIAEFASTGIKDSSTKQTLVVTDDKISVKSIAVEQFDGNFTVRGDVKIYGVLDAGFIRTTELLTNQVYEKQYLEFSSEARGTNVGTGLLWPGEPYNKQLVLLANRMFTTESFDIAKGRDFMIGGSSVLNIESLGGSVVNSSLKTIGTLRELRVGGKVNWNDYLFFDPITNRFALGTDEPTALFTVYDYVNNVELIIDADDDKGRIGTFNTKSLELVTDNQTRITVDEQGHITIGSEFRDSTVTRVYGKMSVGVKNPTEQFEVAGNMRVGGKLFAQGTEPPREGQFKQGDVVWNSNPLPTGYMGWVCVRSGAPGTWKAFGQINA